MTRTYSNTAAAASLTADTTSGATTMSLDTVSGFPSTFPFTLVVAPDTLTAEVVSVTAVAGSVVTVTRGQDGTAAVGHSAGDAVIHSHSARDFAESRAHEVATTGTHGVAGTIMGTSDAQTVTNKNLTSGTNSFPSSLATLASAQALTNKDLTGAGNTFPPFATLTGVQALTNKDLTAGTNTFPSTLATLTGVQTLTNKTLTAPAITALTLDGVNVSGAYAAYTPVWTCVTTPPALGNGTLVGRFMQVGKHVVGTIRLKAGSTTTFGVGAYTFTLPVAAFTVGDEAVGVATATDISAALHCDAGATLTTSTTVQLADGAGTNVKSTTPFAFANNDVVVVNFSYEAA